MSYSTKPISTRCDIVRTVAVVITAACLLVLTVGFLVAGSYTVKTVQVLQQTYHPEKLASIVDKAAEAMESVHQTTFMLKSGKSIPFLDEVHHLIDSIESMSNTLEHMPVQKMLEESQQWRQTSTGFLTSIKHSLNDF